MKKLQVLLCFILVLVATLGVVVPAEAGVGDTVTATFSYSCTNNNATDVVRSIGQFSVLITDLGSQQASFKFRNDGPWQSSITDVYFDDGVLLGIAEVKNGPGVSFSQGASPRELPGWNGCDPDFDTTADFMADSDSPTQPNGVNNIPGEYVTIKFNLIAGATSWDNLLAQLNSGVLRIGIHVQGYANGNSESFVTGPGTAIKLDSFGASASHGKVSLSWATGTEIDNAGFNLYRSASPEGPRVKVNSGLISAAEGSASGASYSAADIPGYGAFYYWLEDVSTGGATTLHGPVNVTLAPAVRLPTYRPVQPGT